MADYWKSNPRYFCEICKCWLAADKASINFHEGGRRHKANVQKQLKQARFRSAENEKEQAKTEHTLAAIEQAALQAYQKDLAVEFGEAEAKNASLKMIALREKYGGEVDFTGHSRLPQQEEQDTAKIKDEIQANVQRKLEELQRKKQAAAAQQAAIQCPWQLYHSPDGYPYYYNATTGVTQWEMPPEYAQAYGSAETPVQGTAVDAQPSASESTTADAQQNVTESNQEGGSNSFSEQTTVATKRSVDQTELESSETHQPSKRRAGPYGAWSTVAVYERTEDELAKESKEGEGEREEEGDSSAEDEQSEHKLKFEEKTVSSLGRSEKEPTATIVAGGFKGFGFKKRAGNRPQIRQLKTNDL